MQNKILIFDLDNTLYYAKDTVLKIEEQLVIKYFADNLHISLPQAAQKVADIRSKYNYDTDAFGKEVPFDVTDFMNKICDIDMSFLPQDNKLNNLLSQIPLPKYILSDNIQKHITDTLNQIRVSSDNFVDIYGAEKLNYVFKNETASFNTFFTATKLKPQDCILFEDSITNIKTAKSMGITTVYLYHDNDYDKKIADYCYKDIHEALKNMFFI